MDHIIKCKELDIIFGGKENTVMVKGYVPCPTSTKVSVVVVNFGEPIKPTTSLRIII